MPNVFQPYEMKTSSGGLVMLVGRFRFNGASAPTTIKANWITSIAHTSTGIWTITVSTAYRTWVANACRQVSLELDTGNDTQLHFGPYDVSAGTLVVRATTGGAYDSVAAGSNAGNWCQLLLFNKEAPIVDGSGL